MSSLRKKRFTVLAPIWCSWSVAPSLRNHSKSHSLCGFYGIIWGIKKVFWIRAGPFIGKVTICIIFESADLWFECIWYSMLWRQFYDLVYLAKVSVLIQKSALTSKHKAIFGWNTKNKAPYQFLPTVFSYPKFCFMEQSCNFREV